MPAGDTAGLGCPLYEAEADLWTVQSYEMGTMLERQATGTIFVLYEDGAYETYQSDAVPNTLPPGCQGDYIPPNRIQPRGGFGVVWCDEPGVRDRLGWATDAEQAFGGVYQIFEGGAMLHRPDDGMYVLHSDGEWALHVP
jgi:hypothetical protein